MTPNYPNHYIPSDCTYTIKAPPGSNITVSFLHFDLEDASECQFDAMRVSFWVRKIYIILLKVELVRNLFLEDLVDYRNIFSILNKK